MSAIVIAIASLVRSPKKLEVSTIGNVTEMSLSKYKNQTY